MIIPKLINHNHRFRGPIESYKENDIYNSIENALNELKEINIFNESLMTTIKEKTSTQYRSNYYNDLYVSDIIINKMKENIYG